MKCPLLTITSVRLREDAKAADNDCLKEECAWRFPPTDRCCLLELTIHIREGNAKLGQLVNKMPHEGEFRR